VRQSRPRLIGCAEIDHNFSKAHRIVTSSILPVVDQYAQHSRDVWEGSRFWKQFFEASANVSLSGYQEGALEEDVSHNDTTAQDTTYEEPSADNLDDRTMTPTGQDYAHDYNQEDETSIIDSPSNTTGVHSTPQIRTKTKHFASPSPIKPSSDLINTPMRDNTDLHSSPFEPPSAYQPSTAQRQQNPDPLMHRIMDRNFRIQATPHTARKQGRPTTTDTPATAQQTQTHRNLFADSSPMSSPEMAAPQLRSDLFSPQKSPRKPLQAPHTPGISVQTPARDLMTSTGRALFTDTKDRTTRTLWDQESDSDDDFSISPPKTMQFHIPQSRLMQTPAREASRIIVDDLLATAGADRTESIEGDSIPDISPSLVRRKWDDDTF
jgi:DASH complex subunit ASK1